MGNELFDSVDVAHASIDSDGLILTATIRFAGKAPDSANGRVLGCQIHIELETGELILIDIRRKTELGDYWAIGRSSPRLELDQELHPLVVGEQSLEARIPLHLLRGLPPDFDWDVSCVYADDRSRSVDTAGPTRFDGSIEEA